MPTIDIRIDPAVFNEVYRRHLANMRRTQVYYGGAASGKSVFLAQRAVYDLLMGGRNYLICRAVARTLRRSVFAEVEKVIRKWGVLELFTVNQSERVITCVNGYQAFFAGLDDAEKLKSVTPAVGAITDVWVEEATETDRDSIKQLVKRQRGGRADVPKRLTLSFNPIIQSHWIFDDYFAPLGWSDEQTTHEDAALSILKTTYKDNAFLTEDDRRDLESETSEYYYQVYTLGNWGVLGDVIFTNWEVRDLTEMRDEFTTRYHGLDFGFSADPAAVVATHYDRKRGIIYVYDELYERGLTNDLLAAEVAPLIGQDPIACDSAEPKSIVEIARHGLGAFAAKKGKDSVLHGVQWLQQQRIIVDTRCVNMANELRQYQWAKDRYGQSLRRPEDKNNHLIDALRYAYESESMGGVEILW